MKKYLLVLAIISAFTISAEAKTVRTFKPLVQPNPAHSFETMQALELNNSYNNTQNEKYPKITELELNLFNRSFENENIYSRLTRLENRVFKRSFSGQALSNRVDNLFTNIDEGLFYGIKEKDLLKLEMRVLGRTYNGEDTATRITRLEKEMLGAMQSGNIKERFETVKLASKHYNTYPEIVQNSQYYNRNYNGYPRQYYTNNTGMGVNGFMQNILGKLFGDIGPGTITGYTPPIYDSYNQYSPYSGYGINPNYGIQDYNIGNTGGYYRNKNYGGGAGVRILN